MLATLTKPSEKCSSLHICHEAQDGHKNPLAGCKLDDLKEMAITGHAAFSDHLRSGIGHALASGRALVEIKTRIQHGQWKQWLADNFNASYETAASYMRLANGWHLIENHGLDKPGVTLQQLLALLTKMKKLEQQDDEKPEPGMNLPDSTAPAPPTKRAVVLVMTEEQAAQFEEMLEFLWPGFDTGTKAETAFAAVKRCWGEYVGNV